VSLPESNGHGPGRTATIDITVSDRSIIWGVGSRDAEVRSRTALEMRLTPRRKQTISLLAELIRTSTDVNLKRTDLEQTPAAGGKSMLYDNLLKVAGHELFDLLFVGDLRGELSDQLVALRDGECDRLRVKLCFTGNDQEWLAMLPWEYARTPPGDPDFDPKGEFLSEVAELLLSRRIELRRPRELGRGQWPLRVLLVCSSPARAGEQQLAPVSAVRIIEQLETLEAEGRIELRKLVEDDAPDRPVADFEPQVTCQAFKSLVQEFQPAIVHFIGHGQFDGTGRLAFSDVDGTVDWVDEWALRKHINASKDLKLVFLQACESALPDPYVSFSGVARTLAASGVAGRRRHAVQGHLGDRQRVRVRLLRRAAAPQPRPGAGRADRAPRARGRHGVRAARRVPRKRRRSRAAAGRGDAPGRRARPPRRARGPAIVRSLR
jgi:hypothetical protein